MNDAASVVLSIAAVAIAFRLFGKLPACTAFAVAGTRKAREDRP